MNMSENQQKNSSDIADELGKLGENMGNLLRNMWNMDERKYVESELRSGLEQLSRKLNLAVEQFEVEANLKKARIVAKEAWETARGPQIVEELRTGMVDGLRKLNDEMARRTQTKAAHEAKGPQDGTVI